MNAMLDAALAYAAKGWPVFPCSPATKAPLVEGDRDAGGRLIPNTGGVKKASVDELQIRRWWKRHPNAMIGLACGEVSGFWVIDIENGEKKGVRHVAEQILAKLEGECDGQLPLTYAVRTGTGGMHLYYRMADGQDILNWVRFMPGCDVRTTGGYVIAPPSVLADGTFYDVMVDQPIAEPSAELLAAIPRLKEQNRTAQRAARPAGAVRSAKISASDAVRRYALAALDAETRAVATMGSGGRNARLNEAALKLGSLIGAGALSEAVVRAALMEAAGTCGLVSEDGERACDATISSGLKAGILNPRDLAPIEAEAAARAARWQSPPRGRSSRARARDGKAPPAAPATAFVSMSADPSAPPAPGQGFTWFSQPSHTGASDEDGFGRAMRGIAAAVRFAKRCALRPMTDLGNAERFALRHGNRFRWCDALGWLAWDGKRWSRDNAEAMLAAAVHDTVRGIQHEARLVAESGVGEDDDGTERWDRLLEVKGTEKAPKYIYLSDALRRHGRASEAAGRIAAIPQLIKGLPGISVGTDAFDADKMVLAVENGVLRFHRPDGDRPARIELMPHDPALMISKFAPVVFDPDARSPVYDAFFARVQPDPEIRRFLHAWAGYNMTGDISAQCFVILHGAKGANGKSTWESLRAHLLGSYSTAVKIETFLDSSQARRGSEASPDLARLPGARHVRTSEPPKGAAFAEELIKVITGTETMTVRHLNRDFFEFLPEMKITVQCNREPRASDDPAFWRRVIKVPFDVSIPVEERDPELLEKLKAEDSGVLNHMLAGLCDWMTGGLPRVDRIETATAEYRERSDVIGTFLRAATVPDEAGAIASARLYEVYRAWCVFAGETAWKQKTFSTALMNAGLEKVKSSSMQWKGLRLVRDIEAFVVRELDGRGGHSDRALEEMGPAFGVPEADSAARDDETPDPPAPPPDAETYPEGEWDDEW